MSNFEAVRKPGWWEPLEKRKPGKDEQPLALWLSDVDAMVLEMIRALTTAINQ